ncbi:MAG TPA: hypothetical protein VH206_01900 [Xanthobacteraceae bacterium]|jgi:hypothetical protein|nr:hypothetical protein [Xanthobacteraceae bacterium]
MNRKTSLLSAALCLFALVGGLVMAIRGASPTLFIGLLCFGCGIALILMGFEYKKKPYYVQDGIEIPVGPAMVMSLFALGALLGAGGFYVLFFGLPGVA